MNDQIAQIFTVFLYALIIAVIVRSLFSWFPISPNNQYVQLLDRVTDPLLSPVRQLLPRNIMIDFSGMIVIVVLYVMIAVVKRAANA